MNKRIKRNLALLCSLVLVLSMLPATAWAAVRPVITDRTEVLINPMYADILMEEDLVKPAGAVVLSQTDYCTTIEEAAVIVREQMKQRLETVTVNIQVPDYKGVGTEIFYAAVEHTGDPAEGDYLYWQWGGHTSEISDYSYSGGIWYLTYTYTMTYYTSAEQELAVDAAVDALQEELGLASLSGYDDVKAIYDWMTANVTYDYDHLGDSTYKLMRTAYGAIIDRTVVCQGYAVLLYRLLLEEGIDNRIVTGTGNGGGHAWNIVNIDGLYYNLDATWDASWAQAGLEYEYFLRCDANFADHIRDDEYSTEEFYAQYPMGDEDYTPPAVIAEGTCGENLIWELDDQGTLTISGEGQMYEFYSYRKTPWYNRKDAITSVVINSGATTIGSAAFANLSNLKTVVIPEGVTTIGDTAFTWSVNLETVTIPKSVTSIGSQAFLFCKSLDGIWVSEENPYFSNDEYGVLFNKDKTELITAPNSLSGTYTVPDSVEKIGVEGFGGCENLVAIVLPESVVSIADHAFSYCYALTDVNIPSMITRIEIGTFLNCSALTTIDIPDSVVFIGGYTFSGCSSLKQITIPEGVSHIQLDTFYGCSSLESIVIPASVAYIMNHAFDGCSSLKEITFAGDVPSFTEPVFTDVIATAYYPAGNETWTEDVMQDYGGTLTWVAYGEVEEPVENPFTDVPEDKYYFESVMWAVENNVTAGRTETYFGVGETCTRAQIVTFLWRAMGEPEPTTTVSPFTDVQSSTAYYYKAVLWAVETGVTSGRTATYFGVTEDCTRAQIVTFLWRAMGEPKPSNTVSSFPDVQNSNSYYYNAVLWAVENKITSGMADGTFGVNSACTREQAVTFLYRALNDE